MKELIKQKLQESINFEIVENLLDEEHPTNFDMAHFKTLKSFKQRVQYCQENLQRISSGSSRIVYKIDNEKVLKLAKNEKGLAQNGVEIQWGQDSYFERILAHTFDSHPNDLWVEMELARKVSKSIFRKLVGADIDDVNAYLRNKQNVNNGRKPIFHQEPEMVNILDENDFVNNVLDFMLNTDSGAGDLGRLNSYGLVKRNGQDAIVIIDFGLTNNIYTSYYS